MRSSTRFVRVPPKALQVHVNEFSPRKTSSSRMPQFHSASSQHHPACREPLSARFLLLHETRGKNRPAISSRLSFLVSTCPHPAKSIRSPRSSPRDAARSFLPLALCTTVAKKLLCLP